MWDQKMWDGHSCPSPLTLVLILIRPSMLRLFLVSNSDQTQKRRTGVSVPHKPSAARPSRKEGGDFDFPCRESKSQWTYARGIPPFATNAKDGAPGPSSPLRPCAAVYHGEFVVSFLIRHHREYSEVEQEGRVLRW